MIWLCTSRPESEHLPPPCAAAASNCSWGRLRPEPSREWLVAVHRFSEEAAEVAAAICLGLSGAGTGAGR